MTLLVACNASVTVYFSMKTKQVKIASPWAYSQSGLTVQRKRSPDHKDAGPMQKGILFSLNFATTKFRDFRDFEKVAKFNTSEI